MKKIYLDYAATTPVDKRVVKEMLPYFGPRVTKQGSCLEQGSYLTEKFGNTMSLHSFGQEAKLALEESREEIASFIGADPEELIFTSSATESNNLALKGVARASKGKHIIISSIEHPCIMESAKWLERQGYEIARLRVGKEGLVDLKELEKSIRKDTILVSIIHASNEIGVIQSVEEIGRLVKEMSSKLDTRIYFHTDAVQSFGKIPLDVNKMNIDLLSASSHKIYGPKGAACLFIRKGVIIQPLLHGGGQELGLRSSTMNIPGIVGFAKATQIAKKEMKREGIRISRLRDKIIKSVLKNIPGSHLNGSAKKSLPNIVNFWFESIEGESLIISLDLLGIAVSTGSACSSAKLEPSHILLALGLKHYEAHGSLRISLGRMTKEKDVSYLLKILPSVIENLRKISPFKTH